MYRIKFSDEAEKDFDEYIYHIRAIYHAPITAVKHYAGKPYNKLITLYDPIPV